MPTFKYKATDSSGKQVRGSIDASDRKSAFQKLKNQSLNPLLIESLDSQATGSKTAGESKDQPQNTNSFFQNKKLTPANALQFLKQLHQLHSNGMPMGESVKLLRVRLSNPALKELAGNIWTAMSEGKTLADSLAEAPKVFPPSITSMIEAGEATGNLSPILHEVIIFLEKKAETRSKIITGLSYPILICGLALCVAMFLIFKLLPDIKKMIANMGGDMTTSAKILLGLSDFIMKGTPVFIVIGIIVWYAWKKMRSTPEGLIKTDHFLFRLPLLGGLYKMLDLLQISNLLGTLLSNGINTTESFRLTEKSIRNAYLRQNFHHSRTQVNEGVSIATAFRKDDIMPELATDILSISENTGNVANGLRDLTEFYRKELENALSRLTAIVSAVALGGAFLLVFLIALSIISSIFQVSQTIGH